VNAEVLLAISDGDQLVASIAKGTVQTMQLAVGEQIAEAFKEASVIHVVEQKCFRKGTMSQLLIRP
jgi:molybdopterin-binding protein